MLETLKPPPTLPPGAENRATKFSGWEGPNSYYPDGDRKIDLYKSDAKGAQDATSDFKVFGSSFNMNKSFVLGHLTIPTPELDEKAKISRPTCLISSFLFSV